MINQFFQNENAERYVALFIVGAFLLLSLMAAFSTQPLPSDTSLISRLNSSNFAFENKLLDSKLVFYRPIYLLVSKLDLKIIVFALRAQGIILSGIGIWLAYLIGKKIFPDKKYLSLILPGSISISPILFNEARIAGSQVIFFPILIFFFYSLVNLIYGRSYYNLIMPLIPFYLFARFDPQLAFVIFLPTLIVALSYFLYRKHYEQLKTFRVVVTSVTAILVTGSVFMTSIITNQFLQTSTAQNLFFSQLVGNLFALLHPLKILALLRLNLSIYLLNQISNSSILLNLIASITSIFCGLGILLFVLDPLIPSFKINFNLKNGEKKSISISSGKKGETSERSSTQLIIFALFALPYFSMFVVGKAAINGFFDAPTIPIMIIPALGVLLFGFYGLKLRGIDTVFTISIILLLFGNLISRI